MNHDDLAAKMAEDLLAIERMRMPFGKYGPAHHPPAGVPIFDLPAEYLAWFAKKGFPKGRLGELLRMVHQMKVDGSDSAFDPMRQRNGGRTRLRPERQRVWTAPEGDSSADNPLQ
jgi:hypothetical protein